MMQCSGNYCFSAISGHRALIAWRTIVADSAVRIWQDNPTSKRPCGQANNRIEKLKKYPRLTEMGVIHPHQIAHFSVNSVDYIDFLRIVYERPKGSLLPVSRSYRFPRIQKTLKTNADEVDDKVLMESSPIFREALAELQKLMGAKERKQDIAAEMHDVLQQLEEEFAMNSEYLKVLIDKIRIT